MAGQSVTFDFLTRGADSTASGFKKVGDNAALASRGAKVLADVFDKLKDKEGRTAEESVILAKALRQTGEAEDRVTARAVLADAAIRRLGDSMQDSSKKSGGLGKALGGLKLNPGLTGPLVALAPAIATLGGVAAGAAAGLGGAFIAGGAALASFGAVAKPVLTQAKTAADAVGKAQATYNAAIKAGVPTIQAQATLQAANASAQLTYNAALKGGAKPATALAAYHLALAKNQLAYNKATNAGVFTGKAYAAEQAAISKAYAGMSPQQIALSKQLGAMANAWDAVKAAQTPVVSGALQPWLKSVTDLTKNLGPIIQAVSPVIGGLGVQFDALINSSAFKGFRDFIAGTGSAAVSGVGSTLIDFIKGAMLLLPKFDPLIRVAVGWIARLGPAFASWAASKKSSDQIQAFIRFFSQNGGAAGTLIKNLGGALKALAPGLTSGGALELKVISDFLGWVAKLPPAFAKPLAEVAGSLLILSKMGVLKVGVQIVGAAAKWLTGGLISIGGGATAAAEMRAAFASGGAAAAAEIRAALGTGGAAGGAGGAAGGATKGAAGGATVAGLPLAAAGLVAGGAFIGALIRYIGEKLSPSGTFAGALSKMFQGLSGPISNSVLHAFTFGGLEGWLTAKIGAPVGDVENNILAGAKIWGGNISKSITGSWSNVAGGAKLWWGNITSTVTGAWNGLTGHSQRATAGIAGNFTHMSTVIAGAMQQSGRAADNLRTRNLAPLLGYAGQVSGGIQGLASRINPGLSGALNTGGAHVNSFRNNNLGPLQGSLSRTSGGVQGLQGLINAMHGKNVQVGVHASGSGGMSFTEKVAASISSGGFSLRSLAAGGRLPGYGGGDRHPALLESGETVVSKEHSNVLAGAFRAVGVPGYAGGGIAGMVPWAANAGYGFARAAESDLLRKEFAHLKAMVAAAAKAKAFANASPAAGGVPGSGVQRWLGTVQSALAQLGLSLGLANDVLYQMQTESGGNPTIVNTTDSNWLAGHPSVGLMQVIAGTFAQYAGQYRTIGPFEYGVSVNPLANIYAALNYAKHGRGFGSGPGQIGSGHGYDQGGLLMPGLTLAYNGTGRPEQVIPAGRGGAGGHFVLEIRGSGHGTFDAFLLKWLRENAQVHGGGDVQAAYGRR
jgi:hypothetical protein